MLRIRIVSIAAAIAATTAIATVLAASSVEAQTANTDQPGQPLSLLQLINRNATPAPAAHSADAGVKKARSKKIASKKPSKAAQDAEPHATSAQNTAPADAWLAASAAPPSGTAAPASNASPTQPGNAPTDNGTLPSAVVVEGQTVQIAAADQINAIDLAADNASAAPPAPVESKPMEATSPEAKSEAMSMEATSMDAASAESTQPPGDRADIGAASHPPAALLAVASAQPSQNNDSQNAAAANASAANATAQSASPVGSASWIAQVLAALGGAVAAGTVAWFLIGSGPVRTYS
jgi:hypothetical protein